MATGKFSSGDLVTAPGIKICEKSMLQAAHPADWMTVKLTGRVEGKGQNRKTKVKWTLGQQEIVLEHGSKLLELVQRAGAPNLPPPAPSAPDGDDTESS